VVSYRVMLDVPRDLIWFVSGLLAARRRQIGTREGSRRLGCYRQALFALAWFRDKGDIPRLGRGFGLPQSTAYRYLDEVIEVLADRAPGLQEQLEHALAEGVPYLILDGKVVDADRCREKTVSRKGEVIDLRTSRPRYSSMLPASPFTSASLIDAPGDCVVGGPRVGYRRARSIAGYCSTPDTF
jgi:hypothetical protein